MTAKKSKLGVTWHNLTPPRHPASRREPVRHTRPFRANASKSRGSLTNRVYLTLRVFKRDIASSRALSTEVIPAPCLTLFWRPRSMQLWGDRRIGAQSRTGARHCPSLAAHSRSTRAPWRRLALDKDRRANRAQPVDAVGRHPRAAADCHLDRSFRSVWSGAADANIVVSPAFIKQARDG
jgi:hypothetical protein